MEPPPYEFVVVIWDVHELLGLFAIMDLPIKHHPLELTVASIQHRGERKMEAARYGSTVFAVMLMACTNSMPEHSLPPTEGDSQSPIQEEITRRVPQFENEHVEVWKSIIMPNQPLTMHRHDNPRALIALTGGTLRVVNQDGDTHDMTWETGSAYWLEADPPGELHGDVNEGPEPVEVIVVQLKAVGS